MSKLREYRLKKGLSQIELAEKLGLSQPTISDYENGHKRPKPLTAIKIEKIIGVNRNELIFGGLEQGPDA
jgi:transcriptional regulator with XRE-family HTH domain